MKLWKNAVLIIFMISVVLPLGAQHSEAASKYVELELQWEDGRTSHIETLHKDGVTYGSFFSLGSGAGLQWEMKNDNMAVLKRDKKQIIVHMGSRIAEVDGRKVDMGREPVRYISHLYVPIRFLASALDGEVSNRDTKTGKVTVTGLNNYKDTFYGSMMGYSYMISAANGDLEITGVYSGHKTTIPLGIKDINMNTHDLVLDFKWTPKNLLIVTIDYSNRKTGEYDLYSLVFKNQGLIRKSVAHGLKEQHEILKQDGTIHLIDDKNLRIIDDGTGKVLDVTNNSKENSSKKTTISIGLPDVGNDSTYEYLQFKRDLEEKFNIEVDLQELYPETKKGALTEQDVIDYTYKKVKDGELDLIIGLTPNKLAPLVKDNLLFDITDHIENKSNLHKGVLNSSVKGGNGRIYYISPVINTMYFVLQNENVFNDLGVDLLPLYPDYSEFLNTLNQLRSSSEEQDGTYSPIAFAVKNVDEDVLFIGSQLRMFGYNLETPFYKDGQLMNDEWKALYRFFATMVRDYGKGYEEYENGIYPNDNIFSNGDYGMMFSNSFNMELYLNENFSREWNAQSPMKIKADFPIKVSFLPNKVGDEQQNIRQSSLALVKESDNTDILLEIMNYIFSEEYTLKMIESRGKYNHFSSYPFSYPTFYSDKTISILNRSYNENFDVSMIYDVDNGSAVEAYPIPDWYNDFDSAVNKALTDVYYEDKTIDETYEYIFELFEQ